MADATKDRQRWTLARRLRKLRAIVRVKVLRRLRKKISGGSNYWTLEEVMDYFGFTREEVRDE